MRITPARDGVHKWTATFDSGKETSFGRKGMDDYTLTHDKEQRKRYRDRHKKDLATRDPTKPGFLSYYILWGDSTSISQNVAAYKKRFHV